MFVILHGRCSSCQSAIDCIDKQEAKRTFCYWQKSQLFLSACEPRSVDCDQTAGPVNAVEKTYNAEIHRQSSGNVTRSMTGDTYQKQSAYNLDFKRERELCGGDSTRGPPLTPFR